MKLMLSIREVLNGKFEPGRINLIMVFQVNCPGCFIYGFPLLQKLQNTYGSKISCFALATAFEDFLLNSTENVKRLVNTGALVGETLKAQEYGMLSWAHSILSFPVLIDEIASQSELGHSGFVEDIIQNVFEGSMINQLERKNLKSDLERHFRQQPACGKTFASNLMRGTPSFFLFTETLQVLFQWFGHADYQVIKKELDIFIEKKYE